MKGLTADLTPPLPNANRKALMPSPAAAVPSRSSATGMDVNKRIKAPRKTMLEKYQLREYQSPVLKKTDIDETKIVLKRPSQASAMTAPSIGVK